MTEPPAALDKRFSDPNAGATPWSQVQRALETAELFWISTARSDGRPHVTPLVAVWLDGAIHFSTGADEQKAVNLRQNSNVVLTTGCNSWDRGLDIVVEGRAIRITEEAELRRLADAWRTKWDGQWQYEVRDGAFSHPAGGTALVFRVKPSKILAFGKGPFSQTRYRL